LYEKFFGFDRAPFELVPDPDFLFLGESHESALANLTIGVEGGKGFIVITGAVGTGKTTMIRALLRRLGREKDVCLIQQPDFDETELLQSILDGFGVDGAGVGRMELRRRMSGFLKGRSEPAILIIDEAHLMSEDSLEQIRLLSNFEEENRKLLQIILSGQPELKDLMARPRLQPLAQRIEMYYEIVALPPEETAAYVKKRVQVAGNPETLSFDPAAVDMIHGLSGGIPRLINILSDRTLITAYVAGSRRVTPDLVREAYEDLGDVTRSIMPGGGSVISMEAAREASRAREEREEMPAAVEPTVVSEFEEAPAHAEGQEFCEEPAHRETPEFVEAPPDPSESPEARREGGAGRVAGALVLLTLLGMSIVSWRSPDILAGVLSFGRGEEVPPTAGMSSAGAPSVAAVASVPPMVEEPAPKADAVPQVARTGDAGSPGTTRPAYTIHVGSFREVDSASRFAADMERATDLSSQVHPTELETGLWYRVLLGGFEDRDTAREQMLAVKKSHGLSFPRVISVLPPEEDGSPYSAGQ
jgi:general secretion pathway protein A